MQYIILLIISILFMGCSSSHFIYKINMSLVDVKSYTDSECENGLIITKGNDDNFNGELETNEIINTEIICNDVALNVTKIIDPCGDGPGVDEIILVINDSIFIAWYKKLGLTDLENNKIYKTTDKQKCKFKIENNELVEL